jgi:hypothetical protein
MLGVLMVVFAGFTCVGVLGYAVVRYHDGHLSTTDLRRITGPTVALLSLIAIGFGEDTGQTTVGRAAGGFLLFLTLVIAKDSLFEGVRRFLRLPPE